MWKIETFSDEKQHAICSTTVPVGTPLHGLLVPPVSGVARVMDGSRSVAGELKETGQRLFTTHAVAWSRDEHCAN